MTAANDIVNEAEILAVTIGLQQLSFRLGASLAIACEPVTLGKFSSPFDRGSRHRCVGNGELISGRDQATGVEAAREIVSVVLEADGTSRSVRQIFTILILTLCWEHSCD